MAWDSVDDEVGNEDVGYGGIASDFGGTGASGDFGGGFDSSDQGNYGEPDPDVVDKHGNLTQVFQDLIANQALGSSTLSSEYQNYADDLGTEYGLNMDEGMNLDFDRGSIGNFFSGPEGFNKYRGPIAEGTDAHGGFWESFLEGLANILTFGIVDPEFSGRDASATYDKSGKMIGGIGDLSHTFGLGQQPMGVEIGAGRGLGGILGLALPEYQIDMDAGKHGLRGGILEGIAQAKDMFDPGSVKDTRDWTMTSYRDVAPVDPQHLPEEYETFRSYEELKDPGLPFLSSNDLQVLPEKDLQLVYLSDPDALQKIPGFSNPNFRPVGPASDKEIAASRFAMQQKLVDKGIKESPKIIPVKEKEENVPDPWIDSEPEPDQIAQVPLIPRVQPQVVAEEQSPKDKVMSGLLSVYDPSYTTPVTNTGYSQEFLSRYPQFAKAGGYVHKYFSGGGVEGLINQGMRQQQQAAWQGDMNNRPDYLKPFGEMFAPRPPRGGYPKPGWDRPKPIQGFGFGDQLPPRPGLQQGLDPKTYFHTHEAGQVDYPHFPKKFEPPVPKRPDKPQPVWSDTPKPQAVLDQNYQNFVNQSELGPVDTTQGITATESAEIPNQTLPAPAQPPSQEEQIVNKEVDITMPTNVTADIEFPEQIQGTIQNYGIGGWVRDYGLPLAAGAAANYFMPGIGGEIAGPWARGLASAGAGALTGAVTGRGDRGLNAIKGAMLGVGGGGLTQAATSMAGSVPFMGGTAQTAMGFGEALKGAAIPLGIGLGGAMINQVPQGQGPTFGSPTRPLTPEERKKLAYKGITGGESGPVFSPPQGYSPGFTPRWTANEGGLSPDLMIEDPNWSRSASDDMDEGISDDRLREMNPNVLTNITKDLMADPNRTEEQVTKLRNILKRFFDLQTGHGHLDESMGGDIDPGLSGIEQVKVLSKSDEVLDILKSPAYKALSENEQKKLQEHIREDYNFEPLSIAQGGEIPEQENLRPGSFVLTSDVVSDIGDGNTNSGFDRLDNLFGGGLAEVENYALGGGIHGPTGGLDDLRQTTIGGSQAAALSDGEYVLSPRAVKEVGKQVLNNTQATPSQMQKAGAEQLYSFMKNIRLAKHGTPNQPKQQITTGGLRNALA